MSVVDTVIGGAVVASSANVANLLDLRPGRAGKAVLLAGVPLTCASGAGAFIAAAAGGAVAGILADDLGERVMLGDTGANGLGALLGLAAVAGLRRRGRLAVLASLLALNAASEKVSFTDVIARNPVLRRLDSVGRSP
jgi:UDP-N-acetylmuramyl pentapeptide phosphotransferase/UDP-N-acetylglucosamine-1-phosphate transferase